VRRSTADRSTARTCGSPEVVLFAIESQAELEDVRCAHFRRIRSRLWRRPPIGHAIRRLASSSIGAGGPVAAGANGDDMTVTSAPIDPEALAIPAPYVDRFQISTLEGVLVRIAFAEALAVGAKGNYRAAVMMTASNAKELALTILNVLGTAPPTPS